jgi:hypothetical protein
MTGWKLRWLLGLLDLAKSNALLFPLEATGCAYIPAPTLRNA